MDKNENTAERRALKRLANAVANHLGIGTQSTHLKGFAYSEAVRRELHAAHAEADAAIHATPQPASEPVAKPYAYAVYFPDQPTEELVHDLDELCDDMTNREHTITELFAQPAAKPRPQPRPLAAHIESGQGIVVRVVMGSNEDAEQFKALIDTAARASLPPAPTKGTE